MHPLAFRVILSLALFVTFNLLPLQATAKPYAVPTFHSIGLYYRPWDGSEDNTCHVDYKILGEPKWRSGLDLWFDPNNDEYRGSLVNLYPGVTYKILAFQYGLKEEKVRQRMNGLYPNQGPMRGRYPTRYLTF